MLSKSVLHKAGITWSVSAKLLSVLLLLSLLLSGQGAAPARAAGPFYVRPGGPASGSCGSWAGGCDLQYAINKAASGESVWVERGPYTPTVAYNNSSDARMRTFTLKDGVQIYGGFSGLDTVFANRNPALYQTTLSGDFPNTPGDSTDNSYHVVRAGAGITSTAVLDGFTITAGYAWDGSTYLTPSQIGPLAQDDEWSGGGMFLHDDARDHPGPVSPTLANLLFTGNTAGTAGGGLAADLSSSSLTNVTFRGNTAVYGDGGGLGNYLGNNLTLTNVTFSGNSAPRGDGGGMNDTGNGTTLINVTFSGNSALNGGAVSGGNSTISDGIFWGDSLPEFANLSSAVINDSIITGGGCPSWPTCTNILGGDPLLNPLANYGGFTPTMSLATGSSAIDAVLGGVCAATDQRGVTRPVGAHCDIGAVEYLPVTIGGTITGAGASSVTMSYTDGTHSTVFSAAGPCPCNYTITVPSGWSGTVTPYLVGYGFTPDHRSYSAVNANVTGQDYTAFVAHEIDVFIHGGMVGSYLVPSGASTRPSYPGINSGPVQVLSADSTPIIATERLAWFMNGTYTSIAEMMGLPGNQLTDSYVFSWYNDSTMDTELRIGNVGFLDTNVTVTIGPTSYGPYSLLPGQSIRPSYPGVNAGPVTIQGTGGVPIVATERLGWSVNGTTNSITELMGLPSSALTDTYVFAWYNDATMDTQFRIGNVGLSDTNVTITIGPTSYGPYLIHTNDSIRPSFVGVNNGPVTVHSTGSVPIIATERLAWLANGTYMSIAEMMGLPSGQLTDNYVFSWYNDSTMDTQLRIGNVSLAPTSVTVTIGTTSYGPYPLLAGQSIRPSYPGVNNGPVTVHSTGSVPIIVTERLAWMAYGVFSSVTEMMGLPHNQLWDNYAFAWYNDASMDTQLRIGVP